MSTETQKNSNSISTQLNDSFSRNSPTVKVRVVAKPTGITIYAEGYGDSGSEDGHGSPVFLELYNGDLRLIVWDDITNEDPSHVISLRGAKETCRTSVLPFPKLF
jgi:hypothetical protein